jgi:GNAT superfamily N-acetyltransferase
MSGVPIDSSHGSMFVANVTPDNAKREDDSWQLLKDYLALHQEMYPAIQEWTEEKVHPGTVTRERRAHLLMQPNPGTGNPRVAGAMIIKFGPDAAKLCHLSIAPHARGMGWGTLLMGSAMQYLPKTENVIFTAPASVYFDHENFFKPLGFVNPLYCRKKQYRHGTDEVILRAGVGQVWRALQTAREKRLQLYEYKDGT